MKFIGKAKGKVIRWDSERKFGFASIDEVTVGEEFSAEDPLVHSRQDAFLHHKDVIMEGYRKLIHGQLIEFDMYRTPKGITGKEIKVIGDGFDSEGELNGNM